MNNYVRLLRQEKSEEKIKMNKEELLKWNERFAEGKDFIVNPSRIQTEKVVESLLKNEGMYGKRYCPCQVMVECPCDFKKQEIWKKQGRCLCGLFEKRRDFFVSKKVKVYSTPTCPYCDMLKDFLRENNVEFQEINVFEDNKAARELVLRSGSTAVPQIEINGKVIVGFDKEAITKEISKLKR